MTTPGWTISVSYRTRLFGKTHIAERTGIPDGAEQDVLTELREEISAVHPHGKIFGDLSRRNAPAKETTS